MAQKDWTSQFDSALDTVLQMPTLVDGADVTRVSQIHALRDALFIVEALIGKSSSPAAGSIRARLNALEAAEGMRVWEVGQASWQYSSIADAITAINADPVPPAAGNRCMVLIHPGYYTMTSAISVPQYVGIKGVSKGLVQLYNATTNMFTCGGNNWFEDFLIEGSPTTTIVAFDGNDKSDIHIRRVDMLKNGGNCKQLFLLASGANWATYFVEDCIIDWYNVGGTGMRLCSLDNTAAAARDVDVTFNNVFFDAYQLTDYATMIACRGCKDVRVKNSTIRGAATYHTGVRVEVFGVTGTPEAHVRHSFLEGGVPVYGEASTNYYLINTDAIGAATAGSRTMRNSSVS